MPGFEIFGEEEKQQILEVLDTGVLFRYEFGEQRRGIYKVKEFEEKFADYNGAGYAQAVSSGLEGPGTPCRESRVSTSRWLRK